MSKSFNTISTISSEVEAELNKRKSDRLRFIGQTPFANAISGLVENGIPKRLSIIDLNKKSNDHDISTSYIFDIFRPKPGLIRVSSEYKNKFGSVRKTIIEWYCPNLKTMEEFSPYFMTLGNTVYVEWGWTDSSHYTFDNRKNETYTIVNIKNKVLKTESATFDATIGIITNYSFALNDDESFTCTTELTSIASLFESVMTTGNVISPNIINSNDTANDSFLQFRTYLNSGTFYNEIYDYAMNPEISKYYEQNPDHRIVFASSGQFLEIINSYSGNTRKSFKYDFDSTKYPMYISWGFIEDVILGNNYNVYIKSLNGYETKLILLDSTGNRVNYYNYIRSVDLGVCIFPIINEDEILLNGKDNQEFLKIPDNSFNLKDYAFNGEIRKILVHTEFFKKTISQSDNIMNGIVAVLNAISDVCGGYFEFILTQIENDNSDMGGVKWQVTSLNQINSEYIINNVYNFDIGNGQSNIINASVKTGMTNIAALNVFYNAQSDSSISHGGDLDKNLYSVFEYDSKGYEDIYGFQNNLSSNNESLKNTEPEILEYKQLNTIMQNSKNMIVNKHEKFGFKYLKRYLPVAEYGYNYTITRKVDNVDKEIIRLDGEEGMKYGISSYVQSDYDVNNILSSIVPIEVGIDLDGISGFNISDAFIANFIHSRFNGKGVFQIVGISDSVDRSQWKTQLKVNFRAIQEIKGNLYRYVMKKMDKFWESVKVDLTLVPKFEKQVENKTSTNSTIIQHTYYSMDGWALPVSPKINGVYTNYHDSFTGYRPAEGLSLNHKSIDIPVYVAEENISIFACMSGEILKVSRYVEQKSSISDNHPDGGYGNFISIKTGNIILIYAHLYKFQKMWKIGDSVNSGDVIGYMGNTGNSEARHLHLECTHVNGTHINPMAYLYSALVQDNIVARGIPYVTAYSISNGQFSKPVSISNISDYEKLRDAFIVEPGMSK